MKPLHALLLLAALVGLLYYYSGGRAAFTNPADNVLPNPSIESWNTAETRWSLPTGWNEIGYSHGPGHIDLLWAVAPDPVHDAAHSLKFLNKGLGPTDTRDTPGACDDWCIWESPVVTVGASSPVNGRFWFYPVSLTHYAGMGNDGPRVMLNFLNRTTAAAPTCSGTSTQPRLWYGGQGYCKVGSGLGPTNAPGPNLNDAEFATPAWRELTFTGTSPATAPYANFRIEIGTRAAASTQLPLGNRFHTTFYLDDFWIESVPGGLCTEGATQACTNPQGIPGTQTCLNNAWTPCQVCASSWTCGDWLACVGGTQSRTCTDARTCNPPNPPNPWPTQQACTAYTIHDRATQFRSGTRTMQELLADIAAYRATTYAPPPALVQAYDAFLARFNPAYAQERWYGWQSANYLNSLLTMYDATGQTAYLDRFKTLADRQITEYDHGWCTTNQGCWDANDTAQGGSLISEYLRFAHLVRRDSRTTYAATAQAYYDFAKDLFLGFWAQQFHNFTLDGTQMGCVDGSPPLCDRWNAAAGVTLAFLYADLYQPTPDYKKYVEYEARFFKHRGLQTVTDCPGLGPRYQWGYRAYTGLPGDVDDWGELPWREETHYAVYDARLVADLLRHQIVFTSADIPLFTNTFKGMWNGNPSDPDLMAWVRCWQEDPELLRHDGYETGQLAGIARFGAYDPALLAIHTAVVNQMTAHLDADGAVTYYMCRTKADGTRPCWAPSNSGNVTRKVDREMYLQALADTAYAARGLP